MFDKALLKLPGMKAALALLLVASLVQATLIVGQCVFLSLAIANLWTGSEAGAPVRLLGTFFACFALRHVVAFVQDELLDRYAQKRAGALRSQALRMAFGSNTSLAFEKGTAATALTITQDVDDVARYVRILPPKLCAIIGMSVPILAALFVVDWVSGVIALVAFPVIMLFMVVLGRQANARAERQFSESQRLSNHFLDAIRGIETIITLGAGKRTADTVYSASERMRVSTVKTLSTATLSSALLDLITVFGIAAVAMMLAFRLLDGTIDLATALMALILAPEFFAPIRSFASDFHASLDGKNALAAILAMLGSAEDGISPDGGSQGAERAHPASPSANAFDDSCTFEASGIGYSYTGDADALHDVSFAVEGCVKVGIVGASGAGKSTLVDVLGGLRPASSGALLVNNEVLDACSQAWRNQVHYIPQHPHVFHMTLFDNMRFYAPDTPRAEVENIVDAVGLRSLVNELPDGLDTVVGESGRALSGGEAQRVALARTILSKRHVLIFDEPTAHLDIETELDLKSPMLACMQGKLVFFATHRLHWLKDMDYVIVLENGSVAEAGVPTELLAHEGALARFAQAERGRDVA